MPLEAFAKEAQAFDRSLRPFNEVGGGDHGPIALRQISSSDWQLYVLLSVAGFRVLVYVLGQISTALSRLVEIRSAYRKLVELKVPDAQTGPVKLHADGMLATELRTIAEAAVDKFGAALSEDRKNELKNHLTISSKFLVKRIDVGLRLDLRLALEPEGTKKDEGAGVGPEGGAKAADAVDFDALRQLQEEAKETTALLASTTAEAKGQLSLTFDEIVDEPPTR